MLQFDCLHTCSYIKEIMNNEVINLEKTHYGVS